MDTHPPFTLQHLRILLAVASQGSVTRAAESLALTQPAVSQGLKELERRLGVTLLERGAFELTDAGRAFLPAARDVLEAAERAVEAAASPTVAGSLTLAASTTIGNYLLPTRLGDFASRYPAVELQLLVGNTSDVCDRVAKREVDVGFIEGRCTRPELDATTFATDELVLVSAVGGPLSGEGPIAASALEGVPFILREAGSGTREVIVDALHAAGARLSCSLCLGNTEAIKTAVAAGLGVSIVSRLAIGRELTAGVLCARPVQGVSLVRPLYRVERRGSPRRAVVASLLACLGER